MTRKWAPADAVPPTSLPQEGEIWQHYKGGEYAIIGLSLREDNLHWVVSYSPLQPDETYGQIVFTRPLSEWLSLVDKDGDLVPRYKKENGTLR